jgi:hypothetical protein
MAIAQSLSGQMEAARATVAELLKIEPTLTAARYRNRHPAGEHPTGKLWAEALGKAGVPKGS